MPHVEVLPNSTSVGAPGWTYVVDNGYDPSKVAFNPKDRKRVAQRPGGARPEGELSARQQTAIARRITELGRDNDPKQSITVPNGKGAAPKTQNTRRILQYQRQIKHWIDDEEALLQQAPPPTVPRGSRAGDKLRRQSTRGEMGPPGTPGLEGTPGPSTAMAPPPTPITNNIPRPQNSDDPLLSISNVMPPPFTQSDLDALLSAPPLLYGASHAADSKPGGPPQRKFCDNCGYWGKIKCLKCGARVCGMECKDAHEATRCLKWG